MILEQIYEKFFSTFSHSLEQTTGESMLIYPAVGIITGVLFYIVLESILLITKDDKLFNFCITDINDFMMVNVIYICIAALFGILFIFPVALEISSYVGLFVVFKLLLWKVYNIDWRK